MRKVKQEFVEELSELLNKHGIDEIDLPFAIGQSLNNLAGHICNTSTWAQEGLLAAYFSEGKVVKTLIDLYQVAESKGYTNLEKFNYNDLDCDLWASHQKINHECVKCDPFLMKVLNEKFEGNCPRCGGTKVDPEFYTDFYTFLRQDHGGATVYCLNKNLYDQTLHIRELKENLADKTLVSFFKKFIKESTFSRYDSEFEYLRYHDFRDKGFIFSGSYSKDRLEGEGSKMAARHLSMIVEHFPCIFEN